MADPDTDAARFVEVADRWYYAERPICGERVHRCDTGLPCLPCVRLQGHDGDHDPTYEPSDRELLVAFVDHCLATSAPSGGVMNADPRPARDDR